MSKKKEKKIKKDKNDPNVKTFGIEKGDFGSIVSILDVRSILSIIDEGLTHSLRLRQKALERKNNIGDAPEGMSRNVNIDFRTEQLIVTDTPLPKPVEEEKKAE